MREKRSVLLPIAIPIRLILARFGVFLLVSAAVALVVVGRANPEFSKRLRSTSTDALISVMDVLSRPVASAENFASWWQGLVHIRAENFALKEENMQLKRWQQMALDLEAENKALRKFAGSVPDPKWSFITARVVGDARGAYRHTFLIHAGRKEGVAVGQAVINDQGLIGRVIEAGEYSARILLLTDWHSRIPVRGENSRERAILSGDANGLPALMYLPDHPKLATGERLVTSGDGDMPAGIPVGVIERIDQDEASVKPWVQWDEVEFVSIIQSPKP